MRQSVEKLMRLQKRSEDRVQRLETISNANVIRIVPREALDDNAAHQEYLRLATLFAKMPEVSFLQIREGALELKMKSMAG